MSFVCEKFTGNNQLVRRIDLRVLQNFMLKFILTPV